MKRPILGLLAGAMLSLGLLGSSPVRAATTPFPTAATATPANDDDSDDHDGHRRRGPCSGLIVLFCRA